MDSTRFTHRGHGEIKAGQVMLGSAFAFINEGVLASAGMSWLGALVGQHMPTKPQIVSLLGPEKVTIFGEQLSPVDLSALSLGCVTSDKSLYQSERDAVNLFVLRPQTAGQECPLIVNLNGTLFSRHSVLLGKHGEGQLALRELPVGEYSVCFEDQIQEVSCAFQVAQYKLAPLVASIAKREMIDSEKLELVLSITSFGNPVDGPITIDLIDGPRRVASATVQAAGGTVSTSFALKGAGPFTLSLQLVNEPSKTASVPIQGSREEERSRTVFSPLGTEVVGSLIGESGSREVRGIFLANGGSRSTPILLEQVDSQIARLRANVKIDALRVVAIDPNFPRRRVNAIDPANTAHPTLQDGLYARSETLFRDGHFADARAILEDAITAKRNDIHPYFAYSLACCCARLGDPERAIKYLRRSIEDGWTDMAHMAHDEDLVSLRGIAAYDVLCAAGTREIFVEGIESGQVVEIEGFAPVTILAIGALIDKNPWEGWASLVPPSSVAPKITIAEKCLPCEILNIAVKTDAVDAAVYCIVKDARLMSSDTPGSRLAPHLKGYVDSASKKLHVGKPPLDLVKASERIASVGSGAMWGSPLSEGVMPPTMIGSYGSPPNSAFERAFQERSEMSTGGTGRYGSAPPAARAFAQMAGASSLSDLAFGSARPDPRNALTSPPPSSHQTTAQIAKSEPEILFAGLLAANNGTASVQVKLPDEFADYIVECFTISGLNWAMTEARFCVEKYPLIHLNLPLFAHGKDQIEGTMFVAQKTAGTKMRVKLLHNGKEMVLSSSGAQADGAKLYGDSETTFQFAALPGDYRALVESEKGEILASCYKTVSEPGKLKHRQRSLKFLRPGESISLADDPTIDKLSILPGIESSFEVLIAATADYGHACCEQTAAIILSACAMYIFAGDNSDQRKEAASIIVAGIRRQQSMWLPGRGFKAYPDFPATPHPYYGAMGARHLCSMAQLGSEDGGDLPPDLAEARKLGLEMAADVLKASRKEFPAAEINSFQDAYEVIRYSKNGAAEKALSFIQQSLTKSNGQFTDVAAVGETAVIERRYLGRLVSERMQNAYGAAALFRAGGAANLSTAIAMANNVVKDFNNQGRLYSTVDSAAAIALMTEMQRASVSKGKGEASVNGARFSFADALTMPEEIKSVEVLDGFITVAVDRIIEEDWSKFVAGMQVVTALLKDGRVESNFKLSDSIELQVVLEEGYKDGDLLWVCLPDALSRVVGGGQVKMFSVDFRGKTELRIPLAATALTSGAQNSDQTQRIMVCVRNMFEEERAASPQPLAFSVTK